MKDISLGSPPLFRLKEEEEAVRQGCQEDKDKDREGK